MNRIRKPIPPSVARNYRVILEEELLAIVSFIKHNWVYSSLILLLLVSLIYIIRPIPPQKVRLATGQDNSTFQVIGERYRELFKREDIELELVPSAGAIQNHQLLLDGKVDAAFSQGGITISDPDKIVRSLGSISYQPLWLFYRGNEVPTDLPLASFLATRRLSINVPGSGTRILSEEILKLHNIRTDHAQLKSLSTKQSIEAMRGGRIEGMFLVAGVESKNLQEIILLPDVHFYNFDLMQAYTKRLRYLSPVVLPKGAISFDPVNPPANVNLVSTTVTLLATDKLHPAIQQLFLEAGSIYDDHKQGIFGSEFSLPAYTDTSVEQSNVAKRFYKKGHPFLWGHAPFWIASLFDEIWFYLLALGAILIPIISFWPSYRKSYSELSIEECYSDLRRMEMQLLDPSNKDEVERLASEIKVLKERVWKMWVPSGNRPAYYNLRRALLSTEADIEDKLQSLNGNVR